MRFNGSVLWTGALLAAGAWGQTPPDNTQIPPGAPTIRTETRLVLVDAVVRDKKGNYVTDLSAKDFKVYEDDKQQSVKTFSFGADPAAPPDTHRRYMVLFFDLSSMAPADQMRARQEAAKFIDANVGPDRLVAIVNFGGSLQIAQNFTDDVARLKQVVSGVRMSATSTAQVAMVGGRGPRLGGMADFGVRSVLMALRSLAKNLSDVPGRKSLVLFTSGFPVPPETMPEVTAAIDACNRANIAIYPVDVRGLTTMPFATPRGAVMLPGAVRDAGIALAGFEVMRIAAFFQTGRGGGGGGTSGGGTSSGGASGGTAPAGGGSAGGGGAAAGGGAPRGSGGTAGAGGTSGTGSGGLGGRGGAGATTGGATGGRSGGGGAVGNLNNPQYRNSPLGRQQVIVPPFPPSASTNQQVMYQLADGTGGFVIANTNDLLGGLERIGKEQNAYYILGYTPPESEEGTCHVLKVKVDRGGANVRARTGYCNVKTANVLAGRPIEKELETRATASAAGTVAAKMKAPFFYTSADTARVNLAIEMPAGDIKFDKVKGKQHAEINVLGMVYREDGEVAARFGDTVKLDFEDKKEVEKFAEKMFHYEDQFDVASGTYTLKVVFSAGGESFGKLETPLKIDPYDGKQFAMSAMALSTSFHQLKDVASRLDLELLEGKAPLTAGSMQFDPSGADLFKTTDQVAIYFELYEPLLVEEAAAPAGDAQSPNPPKVAVQLRVVDSKTGEQKVDSGGVDVNGFIRKGSQVVPIALKLPLNMLAAGSYKLEMMALDSAGRSATRSATFEVQ